MKLLRALIAAMTLASTALSADYGNFHQYDLVGTIINRGLNGPGECLLSDCDYDGITIRANGRGVFFAFIPSQNCLLTAVDFRLQVKQPAGVRALVRLYREGDGLLGPDGQSAFELRDPTTPYTDVNENYDGTFRYLPPEPVLLDVGATYYLTLDAEAVAGSKPFYLRHASPYVPHEPIGQYADRVDTGFAFRAQDGSWRWHDCHTFSISLEQIE